MTRSLRHCCTPRMQRGACLAGACLNCAGGETSKRMTSKIFSSSIVFDVSSWRLRRCRGRVNQLQKSHEKRRRRRVPCRIKPKATPKKTQKLSKKLVSSRDNLNGERQLLSLLASTCPTCLLRSRQPRQWQRCNCSEKQLATLRRLSA